MRILIDVPVHELSLDRLASSTAVDVEVLPKGEGRRQVSPALLRTADALFCELPPLNFQDCEVLQWIQIASAGYAQLFGLDLPGRGIRASNARGCFDVPIAEWNVAMMVNLGRNLRQMIRNQDESVWDQGAQFQTEIRGKTVGIWGYGGIGRETARLAKSMGMRVHVLSRSGIRPDSDIYAVPGTGDPNGLLPDRTFLSQQLPDFLSELDFLILATPLTPETEGMVGEQELVTLPKYAFLLNPARGPLVEEDALLRALRQGLIAGAAIDTHYAYPLPPEHPLWAMPNVILTPHISGSSLSTHFRERIWDIFLQNVSRLQRGQPLLNELAPDRLRF